MQQEFTTYDNFFHVDQRLEVRFPDSQNTSFSEWGVITLFDGDLVKLQFSRDVLPDSVKADTGTILDLRLGKEGSGYCCRAIVVTEHEGAEYTARLIGDVVPNELRDFYRIDTYIPLRYSTPTGQPQESVKQHWRELRYKKHTAEEDSAPSVEHEENERPDDANAPAPIAANISGSGIRIKIPDELKSDDFITLKLYLPLERLMVLDVVGQVVNSAPIRGREKETPLFGTAIRFLYIDERDRDAIVKYISAVQMEHLRNGRGSSVDINDLEYGANTRRWRTRHVIYALAIVILFSSLMAALVIHNLGGTKGEIEQTYEKEIKKYRERVPWR